MAARDAGLPLICGAEFTLVDGLAWLVLAQDRAGYGNLSALITLVADGGRGGQLRRPEGVKSRWRGARLPLACGCPAALERGDADAPRPPLRSRMTGWRSTFRPLLAGGGTARDGPNDAVRLPGSARQANAGLLVHAGGDGITHLRARRHCRT